MKNLLILLALVACTLSCDKADMIMPTQPISAPVASDHPKAAVIRGIVEKYAAKGIPGIVVAVDDASGYWSTSAGFAKLEDKSPMENSMLHYGFSITKMITAISVMQLREADLIDLDAPIKNYLPREVLSVLEQTDKITVKMLLNQTSGYTDYVRTNAYTQNWLDNPLRIYARKDYHNMFSNTVRVQFTPGSDFLYSNTNYYLLALIIDHVTGRHHGAWYREHIFNTLTLSDIYYKNDPAYPFYPALPNAYAPIKANGKIENISRAQLAWMENEEWGTTGIIASSDNYIRLLKGLVTGQLVSDASLQEMKSWVTGKESSEPDYGYGLTYFGYKGKPNFGHDGDGIGASAFLLYFPAGDTYVFIATNSSTEFGGPMQLNISSLRNEISEYLAGF